MNQLPVLIRREFWEHRNTFLVLPAITTGFFLLMMFLILVVSATDVVDINVDINVESENDQDMEFFNDSMQADNIYKFAVYQLDARPTEERGAPHHA